MKQTQLICDLCHEVIMEYAAPRQIEGLAAILSNCAPVTKHTAYKIDIKYGVEPQKPKRVRLDICPKCLYRLEHWDELLRQEADARIQRKLREEGLVEP